MERDEIYNLLAVQQVSMLHALNALLRAVSKQEGVDREKLVKDLINYLPKDSQEPYQNFLVGWREVLETNF